MGVGDEVAGGGGGREVRRKRDRCYFCVPPDANT